MLTKEQKAERGRNLRHGFIKSGEKFVPTLDQLPQADTSDLERNYHAQHAQDESYDNQY